MAATRNARRVLQGTVTSTKAKKTITVSVERTFKHPKYGKYVRSRKTYMSHDENEEARVDDVVEICSTRPVSKRKRWRLSRVVEKATLPDSVEGGGER